MKGGIEVIKEGYVSVFQGINVWMTDEEHYEMKNEDDIYVIRREGEEYYMALKNNQIVGYATPNGDITLWPQGQEVDFTNAGLFGNQRAFIKLIEKSGQIEK